MKVQERLERSSRDPINNGEVRRYRTFIVSCGRHLEITQIHSQMRVTLPTDLFKVKRIRKESAAYTRISIDELVSYEMAARALKTLRLGLGAKTR